MSEALKKLEMLAQGRRNLAKGIEARVREALAEELKDANAAVDLAAAEAFRSGASKASVGRAIGSTDYNTYNQTIERGLSQLGTSQNDILPGGVIIEWHNEPTEILVTRDEDQAVFRVAYYTGDDKPYFLSITPLWSEDFSVLNEVVRDLDDKDSGELYEAASAWVSAH